jgi:hypothetical protein
MMPGSHEHDKPEGAAKGPKYFLNIEGAEYPWDSDQITVPEIRSLVGWESGQQVSEIDLETNDEHVLAEDAIITLKPGHGFAKKIKFQRGFVERWQEEQALLREAYPNLERRDHGGERWCRIPGFVVEGSAFVPNPVDVAFRIPSQAGEQPYAFWVSPPVTPMVGGSTSHYTAPATTPWGDDWAQFSWAPLEWVPKADIRAGANMLGFVRSIVDRLRAV